MRQIEFFCVVCAQPYTVIWHPVETHRFVRMECPQCRKALDQEAWFLFPTVDAEGILRERGLAN